MAEQKAQSISKSFENVQFPKLQDKYDINIEYDANSECLSLKFMNKTNIKTFEKIFNKKEVKAITTECRLSSYHLCEVAIDQLSSQDFINKFCRIFLFSDPKQGAIYILLCIYSYISYTKFMHLYITHLHRS